MCPEDSFGVSFIETRGSLNCRTLMLTWQRCVALCLREFGVTNVACPVNETGLQETAEKQWNLQIRSLPRLAVSANGSADGFWRRKCNTRNSSAESARQEHSRRSAERVVCRCEHSLHVEMGTREYCGSLVFRGRLRLRPAIPLPRIFLLPALRGWHHRRY